jgi:NDP-sugar pyrophosphorylase family protein
MFSGSHCISSRVLRHLPDREFSGIVGDVYQPLLRAHEETLAAIVDDGLWFDIGTPQRYLAAARAFLDATVSGAMQPASDSRVRGDSLLHTTANVAKSVSRSTIGANSIVQGVVDDCAIFEGCTISPNARLTSCIVGEGVTISGTLELHDAIVCRNTAAIPQDPAYERKDGLVIVRI